MPTGFNHKPNNVAGPQLAASNPSNKVMVDQQQHFNLQINGI
jgi:hypothetical protein